MARGLGAAPDFGRLLKAQRLDKTLTGKPALCVGEPTKTHRNLLELLHSLGAGETREGLRH